MLFTEVLSGLPKVDHLEAIELYENEALSARVENQPGSSGSVRVYFALFQEFHCIDARAASKGLELYSEHTADATQFPGKHPNIDRLIQLIHVAESNTSYCPLQVKLIEK
ncbi:DUF2322 family protein [Undibacterium fentianense]|uniref:DUF2322 family protein n=1 Tax=Undibacterium fentianense TaxID=2828728 RepID=A0A941IEB1_9BURK|nr:DUF2322 family protein [Undibacterium fentianense]MBR7799217.1 DUF2322 family protein [Undibacterium fentianense]